MPKRPKKKPPKRPPRAGRTLTVEPETQDRSPDALRAYLHGRTTLDESRVEIGGREYRITHPASADALINERDFAHDERLPYWADLWPSAIALARRVSERDLAGRRVIELGCGVGLPSVVALARGARVLATDHYKAALAFTAHNAHANTGRELEISLLDWHVSPKNPARFDLVLAADVLYEIRNVPALAALVPQLLQPGGELWLADPRRKDTPLFIEAMCKRSFRIIKFPTLVECAGRKIRICVYEIHRM